MSNLHKFNMAVEMPSHSMFPYNSFWFRYLSDFKVKIMVLGGGESLLNSYFFIWLHLHLHKSNMAAKMHPSGYGFHIAFPG